MSRVPVAVLFGSALLLATQACGGGSPTPASAAALAPRATLAGQPDQFITRGDVTIRYREVGEGPPVLLLHGYTDRVEMWTPVADSLAATHNVIVPDLRGFGLSTAPASPGSYGTEMTDDVIALLDTLGIDEALVVGYSMGAMITADLAVRYPSRISGAVLVAGPFFEDSSAMARTLAPFVADLEGGRGLTDFFRYIAPEWPDSTLAPLAAELLAGHQLPALIGSLKDMATLVHDSVAIGRMDLPAVAIVGRSDPLLEQSRWMARHWPGLELTELEDADHIVVFGVPEVSAAVRRLTR